MTSRTLPRQYCLDFFQSGYKGFGWEQSALSAEERERQQKEQKLSQTIVETTHGSPPGLAQLARRSARKV